MLPKLALSAADERRKGLVRTRIPTSVAYGHCSHPSSFACSRRSQSSLLPLAASYSLSSMRVPPISLTLKHFKDRFCRGRSAWHRFDRQTLTCSVAHPETRRPVPASPGRKPV